MIVDLGKLFFQKSEKEKTFALRFISSENRGKKEAKCRSVECKYEGEKTK
jgi:hypothetical protein